MTLVELLALLDRELNLIRRIKSQLTHSDFNKVFESCTDDERTALTVAVKARNENNLRDIIRRKKEQDYELWKIEDLRNFARGIGMPYYATLTKYQLISGITEYELRAKGENCKNNSSCKSGGLGYKPATKTS